MSSHKARECPPPKKANDSKENQAIKVQNPRGGKETQKEGIVNTSGRQSPTRNIQRMVLDVISW
ncbi:hypothetical protein CHS0354_013654 [Potamilus streckersoni]|uniref:Uncharacterized protein n=1 Tax=Potamilus streckersoni TaxID=2493646 RepID=A0AAE0RQT2_9BIVA|nr:hypothetical protein CHS0354_013654 [Potamilus streckersoni]